MQASRCQGAERRRVHPQELEIRRGIRTARSVIIRERSLRGGDGVMIRIFASYSRKDEAAVQDLIADLGRAHLSVWHDQALHGGDPWWQDILQRIRESDVFLFALSKNSLASKPCRAEVSYARALGLPILPVQTGPVGNLRTTPVADIQVVDYRERTLPKGLALIESIQDAAAARRPLPDPLPEPPPVPFEYLLRLGSAIGAGQLTPNEQGDFIRQLREALETEDDEGVRDDARELLLALRRRPDITYRNVTAVDQLLADLSASEAREAEVGGASNAGPGSDTMTLPLTGGGGQPPRSEAKIVRPDPDHESRREWRFPAPRRAPAPSASVPACLGSRAPRGGWRSGPGRRPLEGGGLFLFCLVGVALVRALFFPPPEPFPVPEPPSPPGSSPFPPPAATLEPGKPPTTLGDGTVSGASPGLYGGTGSNPCNAQAIASFLETNPAKAAAWAGAEGIPIDQIRAYLGSLTSVTLRSDTAVTNHGFRNDRASPFESVLQAGTAVLANEYGVPRVRCACGNPLKPPTVKPGPGYKPPWRGFSSGKVTVIQPAPGPIKDFVIVQPDSGAVVARPRGTGGERDHEPAPADVDKARKLEAGGDASNKDSPGGSTGGGSTGGGSGGGPGGGSGGGCAGGCAGGRSGGGRRARGSFPPRRPPDRAGGRRCGRRPAPGDGGRAGPRRRRGWRRQGWQGRRRRGCCDGGCAGWRLGRRLDGRWLGWRLHGR